MSKDKQNKHELARSKQKFNKSKDKNYVVVCLITACVAAIILIVAAIISSKYFDFYIDNKDIVLTFVGIIATFIVVTNYAQVLQIKKDFEQKLDETNLKQQNYAKNIRASVKKSIMSDLENKYELKEKL